MENVFRAALIETTRACKITGLSLSKSSGVAPANISKFLTGSSDLLSGSVSRLFLPLPYQGKKVYCENLLGKPMPDYKVTLADLILRLDPNNPEDRKEAANAIRLIADKMMR